MVIRYILCWPVLVVIAIANGVLRESGYGRALTELQAHQVSTAVGVFFIGLFIGFLSRRWPLASAAQAWTIGSIWLVMTVAFEFLFGHYVAGHPWSRLLHDYDILAGRVWLLLLVWVASAPYVFFRLSRPGA